MSTTQLKELDNGNPDGVRLGSTSTNKVSFWGKTPVVQPSGASQAAVTGTVGAAFTTAGLVISQVATSGKWAFSNSTQAALVKTKINQLRVDVLAAITLVNKLRQAMTSTGLIAGA